MDRSPYQLEVCSHRRVWLAVRKVISSEGSQIPLAKEEISRTDTVCWLIRCQKALAAFQLVSLFLLAPPL